MPRRNSPAQHVFTAKKTINSTGMLYSCKVSYNFRTMLSITLAAVFFLALTRPILGDTGGQLRGRNALSSNDYGEIQCTAVLALLTIDPDVANENGEEESFWACEDEDTMMYRLPDSVLVLDKAAGEVVNGKTAVGELVSGKTQVVISQASLDRGGTDRAPSLLLGPDFSIAIQNDESDNNGRELTSRTGTNTLLVVRCSSANGSPTRSASQLSDDVFGGQGDRHNLASQMDACSGGVLTFEPASGDKIVNGVTDIRISERSNGDAGDIQNLCIGKLQDEVGPVSSWDNVYLVLPDNADFGEAAAFAYVNHRVSVYKDVNGSYLTVMMHEIGHNLGLMHSGENSSYDDHSCMMGNPPFGDDSPQMCFNGQKSWHLGWYSDRHVSITPESSSWSGTLVGVDDYVSNRSTSSQEAVVVRVRGSADLYVMYNKAQGVNSQVQEYGNRVTVVEGSIDNNVARVSTLLGGLRSGDAYRYNNFAGSNRDLIIGVCSLGSNAEVIIYIDGVNNIGCSGESNPSFEETDGGNQDDGDSGGGGGGGSCFPGEAEVTVKGRGSVPMEHLSIGDEVLVADGSFEPVYSFTKRNRDNWVEYLQIYFANSDKPLELTPNHMVFAKKGAGTRAMESKHVDIGDSIILQNGVFSEVIYIDYKWKRGFYAPMTYSGTIVVNQVKASTYATTVDGPLSVDSPWLQNIYWLSQSHHRLICRVDWGTCQDEEYSGEGMSRIVEWSLIQYERFNGLSTLAQIFVGVLVFPALILAAFAESGSFWTTMLVLCCFRVYSRRQSSKK